MLSLAEANTKYNFAALPYEAKIKILMEGFCNHVEKIGIKVNSTIADRPFDRFRSLPEEKQKGISGEKSSESCRNARGLRTLKAVSDIS